MTTPLELTPELKALAERMAREDFIIDGMSGIGDVVVKERVVKLGVRHAPGKHSQDSHGNWAEGSSTVGFAKAEYGSEHIGSYEIVNFNEPKSMDERHSDFDVTSDEEQSLTTYRSADFGPINQVARKLYNGEIRAGSTEDIKTREIQKTISNVSSVTRKAPGLKKNTILYRGIGEHPIHSMQIGDAYEDGGFTSTTMERTIAQRFAEDTMTGERHGVLEMLVPKGTKAVSTEGILGFEDIGYGHEYELLLERGTAWKLVDVDYNNPSIDYDTPIYRVEMIPQSVEDANND